MEVGEGNENILSQKDRALAESAVSSGRDARADRSIRDLVSCSDHLGDVSLDGLESSSLTEEEKGAILSTFRNMNRLVDLNTEEERLKFAKKLSNTNLDNIHISYCLLGPYSLDFRPNLQIPSEKKDDLSWAIAHLYNAVVPFADRNRLESLMEERPLPNTLSKEEFAEARERVKRLNQENVALKQG